jgi:hypothetical protein
MGRYIMKVQDRDLYVEWSSVVENYTLVGTRAEMLQYLAEEDEREHPGFAPMPGHSPEDRLARCDETGTSVRFRYPSGGRDGEWSDPIMIEQRGMLDRDKLGDYIDAVEREDEDAIDALIRPFENDEDE